MRLDELRRSRRRKAAGKNQDAFLLAYLSKNTTSRSSPLSRKSPSGLEKNHASLLYDCRQPAMCLFDECSQDRA